MHLELLKGEDCILLSFVLPKYLEHNSVAELKMDTSLSPSLFIVAIVTFNVYIKATLMMLQGKYIKMAMPLINISHLSLFASTHISFNPIPPPK